MFKVSKNLVPVPIQELFPTYENKYNLRNQRCWKTYNVRTVGFGTETISYRGQKTWQLLPDSIKDSPDIN